LICIGKHNFGQHIAAAAGVIYNPAADHCVARVENGRLLGGCVYQEFTGASIRISSAGFSRKWVSPSFVSISFNYPFSRLGCDKLITVCHSEKPSTLEIIRYLGFIEEARISMAYLDGDMIFFTMLRPQCRWLKTKPAILQGIRP
jgi:RimJ/RimL family protein N-acetyltransferase